MNLVLTRRWFTSFTPQRFYRFALNAEGKGHWPEREDVA